MKGTQFLGLSNGEGRLSITPQSRYAVNVKFQQRICPMGNIDEAIPYYSAIYKLYGYETMVYVLPNGRAISVSPHVLAMKADISILIKWLVLHKLLLPKKNGKDSILDSGSHSNDHEGFWALLCDKGYQSLLEELGAVHLKMCPEAPSFAR